MREVLLHGWDIRDEAFLEGRIHATLWSQRRLVKKWWCVFCHYEFILLFMGFLCLGGLGGGNFIYLPPPRKRDVTHSRFNVMCIYMSRTRIIQSPITVAPPSYLQALPFWCHGGGAAGRFESPGLSFFELGILYIYIYFSFRENLSWSND